MNTLFCRERTSSRDPRAQAWEMVQAKLGGWSEAHRAVVVIAWRSLHPHPFPSRERMEPQLTRLSAGHGLVPKGEEIMDAENVSSKPSYVQPPRAIPHSTFTLTRPSTRPQSFPPAFNGPYRRNLSGWKGPACGSFITELHGNTFYPSLTCWLLLDQ